MNIKRLISRCRKNKEVTILTDTEKHKFLSDGSMYARLEDDTKMTPENIAEILEPRQDKRDDYNLRSLSVSPDITSPNTTIRNVGMIECELIICDERYRAFSTEKGLLLAHAEDVEIAERDSSGYTYYMEEIFGGTKLVAASSGRIFAIITPASVDTYMIEGMTEKLYEQAVQANNNGFFDRGGQMSL